MAASMVAERVKKSVVTCDLEGRIETYNDNAVEIFGYSAEEVIGKKRVSLFSPGLVVLGHVTRWLKTAVKEGEYSGRTVFVRKDGTRFAADIRITPTFRDGKQIGYCGVTAPLPDVDPDSVMPPISPWTRIFSWMVITRAPFLTATIVPVLIGGAWVAAQGTAGAFPWGLFLLALVGGIALHVSANTFNDYFDWRSGTDAANNDYFLPFTGGSRSLELRIIGERGLLGVALSASLVAALVGLALLSVHGPAVLIFGVIGLFAALFYTAPPLRLVARRGMGELLVGLCFGPLMTAGTVFAMTGQVAPVDFLIGLPIGLLTSAILWINEFPDMAADIATGKIHLVAVLGKEAARWGYLALLAGAFVLMLAGSLLGWFPVSVLLAWLSLPLAVYATVILFRYYSERRLVRANLLTISLHLVFGMLTAAGLVFGTAALI